MTIIPHKPYETNSKAEYRVFDKIRESFVNNSHYLAFHSLNLTKHKTKKFSEADFVIVCEYGIFVFEVKGGRVGVENGGWYTINRNNERFRIQNPFKQAQGALYSIKDEIENSPLFRYLKLSIGYGVIFPNVEWHKTSSEWDLDIVCDSRKFKNFEKWLQNCFGYWESKPRNKKRLSLEEIKILKEYLRPNFELLEPLHVKLSEVEESVAKLTTDQYQYLDIVIANSRVLCFGGAGTGKTFLAVELAKRFASDEKNIVLVCKSNWLRRFLEVRMQNEFVTVSTIESLKLDMRRSGINMYDILIVDEGQDLFNFDDIKLLDEVIKGGLKNGEWYIFHDVNNQSGLFVESKIEVLELLEGYHSVKIPLVTNCRNSEPILKKIQDSLHLDMGRKGAGIGPKVHELFEMKKSGSILKSEIKRMIEGGVSPSSITILSPLPYKISTISLLSKTMQENIIELDDYSVRSFPIPEISFSEIKNFKGLENEVIIVIDLPKPNVIKDKNKVEYYVAMSRARGMLSLIWKGEDSFLIEI